MQIDTKTQQLKSSITCHTEDNKLTIYANVQNVSYQGQKTFDPDVQIAEIIQAVNNRNFKIIQKTYQSIKLRVLCFNIELKNIQKMQVKRLQGTIQDLSQKYTVLQGVTQQLMLSYIQLKGQLSSLSHKLQISQEQNLKLAQQLIKVHQIISETSGEWIYYESPKHIATFKYDTLQEVSFNFQSVIPKTQKVKEIKLVIFLTTGNQPNAAFQARTRVVNEGKEFQHWTFGYKYPQNAISYNSETVVIPIQFTRQIHVKANLSKPINIPSIQYHIVAYKL